MVSDPQFGWGIEVLERLDLNGDEDAIDAGCGSGRVTAELAKRLPGGSVLAVDASKAMIAKARERLGEGASYLVADLAELQVSEPVDLVFSTATFHWIPDHERLFERLRAALRPGGRLVAQCGGRGNIREHAAVLAEVMALREFAPHFAETPELWNYAGPEETETRLSEAGFADARCWLQPKPVAPADPLSFTMTSTLGAHLARLPRQLHERFAEAIIDRSARPFTLEYVRLNIEARLAPAA
ncbi:MAG TPA: methyltransferase domain-containing protein [Solirubrobacterales bacterium]|nr:methyltransferase domain-containing protein [Solirubrobacterales bacterium]